MNGSSSRTHRRPPTREPSSWEYSFLNVGEFDKLFDRIEQEEPARPFSACHPPFVYVDAQQSERFERFPIVEVTFGVTDDD